ncbi:MAG: putative transporter, substrate binding subunit [Sphingomonadales bacterium]|nr:putative transporter, substrate binding subunit [Sphingomonadales bacterium]
MINTTRRAVIVGGGLIGLGSLAGCGTGSSDGRDGRGTLVIGFSPEPATLTSATTTAGPTQSVSSKIFDGLVTFDAAFNPQPQLATGWTAADDHLSLTLKLRSGVKWHDGKPFTSEDVAYSLTEVWKKLHARGRSTFANVVAVDTPDPLTAILRFSKPVPYLISALGAAESQVIPKHIYAGKDVLSNPANLAPIGTGPFQFVEWERGQHISLERNPDYWDRGRPGLDRIIYRIFADSNAASAALETGEVHLVTSGQVPLSDIKRLSTLPAMRLYKRPSGFTAGVAVFEFNLDKPVFRDPRVRQAFAHAIDKDFIRDKIWYGFGTVAESPIPRELGTFNNPNVTTYPFDLKKAADLLDAAGFRPDAQGIRLRITHDAAPTGDMLARSAGYIRDSLRRIGVDMQLRSSDFASFLKRVYTDRDFDTLQYAASAGPDPAIGTQRFYWSKNYQPGVAFSNGAHYVNPKVDALLEQAQIEPDPIRRKALYDLFQTIVEQDLPRIPLISAAVVTIASARVQGFPDTAYGTLDNFSGVSLAPA